MTIWRHKTLILSVGFGLASAVACLLLLIKFSKGGGPCVPAGNVPGIVLFISMLPLFPLMNTLDTIPGLYGYTELIGWIIWCIAYTIPCSFIWFYILKFINRKRSQTGFKHYSSICHLYKYRRTTSSSPAGLPSLEKFITIRFIRVILVAKQIQRNLLPAACISNEFADAVV